MKNRLLSILELNCPNFVNSSSQLPDFDGTHLLQLHGLLIQEVTKSWDQHVLQVLIFAFLTFRIPFYFFVYLDFTRFIVRVPLFFFTFKLFYTQ